MKPEKRAWYFELRRRNPDIPAWAVLRFVKLGKIWDA
jgi:hypothetical protein